MVSLNDASTSRTTHGISPSIFFLKLLLMFRFGLQSNWIDLLVFWSIGIIHVCVWITHVSCRDTGINGHSTLLARYLYQVSTCIIARTKNSGCIVYLYVKTSRSNFVIALCKIIMCSACDFASVASGIGTGDTVVTSIHEAWHGNNYIPTQSVGLALNCALLNAITY